MAAAAATLGGIVASHLLLETARDALFLANLPPHDLAGVYLAMSLLGFLVGRYDRTVTRALGRSNALILALMVGAMGGALFYLAELGEIGLFGLYLWTGLVGTLLTMQFWLFVAARFTVAQGRRLYGLVAAGGVLGAVAGGVVGTVVTRYFPVHSLLVISAGVQLVTALSLTMARQVSQVVSPVPRLSFKHVVSTIGASPYLLRIAAMTACATVAVLLTDYLFKSVTAAKVPAAELGGFLARYYTGLNAAALVMQVFIVMQVLQRAGTILALSVLPLLLLLGGGATVAFGGSMLLVSLVKGADGALRHSLHRVSSELLFLPLSHADRTSAKPLVDSVVSRAGQALGAVLILVLVQLDQATPRVVAALLAGTALLWVGLVLSLRGPYLNQFRQALARPDEDTPFDTRRLDLEGVAVVLEALSSPEDSRAIAAMSMFDQMGRSRLIPALVLYHPSAAVLIRALTLIPDAGRSDWVALTIRLLSHPDSSVRLAAVSALGRTGHGRELPSSDIEDVELRATACFFRADELAHPEEHQELVELMNLPAADRVRAELALVRNIAELGDVRWGPFLRQVLAGPMTGLERLLPRAMANTRDPRFIPELIARLAQREGRSEVNEALVALSDEGLAALATALRDPATDAQVLLHIPRAVSGFQVKAARDLLVEILESDLPGVVRFKALRGLGRLSRETHWGVSRDRILPLVLDNAHEALRCGVLAVRIRQSLAMAPRAALPSGTLLVSLLQDKMRQSTERVTRLLALVHTNEDLRRVYFALTSGDPAALANAGEMLEVLTLGYDEDLRDCLRSMSDPVPLTERLSLVEEQLGLALESHAVALREALADDDAPLSALAAEYASQSDVTALKEEIQALVRSNPWLQAPLDNGRVTVQAPLSMSKSGPRVPFRPFQGLGK